MLSGVSRGLGLALARDLLARGYGVAGCSTSFNDDLKALVDVHDGKFLWAGVDMDPAVATGREACERLLAEGVLAKDTHGSTIRLAPPLVVEEPEVELLVDALGRVLS